MINTGGTGSSIGLFRRGTYGAAKHCWPGISAVGSEGLAVVEEQVQERGPWRFVWGAAAAR